MGTVFITSDNKMLITYDNKTFVASIQNQNEEVNKMSRFNFHIITGSTAESCQAKYDAIATKNAFTFYLFQSGGIGYLGNTQLFNGVSTSEFHMVSSNLIATDLSANQMYFVTTDCTITDGQSTPITHTAKAGSVWVTDSNSVPTEISATIFATYMANYITNNAVKASEIDGTFASSDNNLMTSAAVEALIEQELSDQSILQISFFKNVKTVTLTSTDIDNEYVEVSFDGGTTTLKADLDNSVDHAGDIGLVFQLQFGDEYDESDSDGDECVFINLHGLIDKIVAGTSNTTTVTVQNKSGEEHTKEIIVEVNKADNVSFTAANISGGADSLAEGSTYDTSGFSQNKFVTEQQFASLIANILKDYVKYSVSVDTPEPTPTPETTPEP